MNEPVLKIRNLTVGHKDMVLYGNVCLDICKGDCIMLCGANGSGKTTLLKAVAGLSEEVVMIPARIPKVGGFTLKEFVRIGCFRQTDMGGKLSAEDEKALEGALEKLNMKHLSDRDISTLSDGEFQKAGIAAALVRKASVILLDEPTAFLDVENRISVLNTLRRLCDDSGTAVIFSTHDIHDGLNAACKVIALCPEGRMICTDKDMQEAVRCIFRHI